MIFSVYKATCSVNQKSYIGFTQKDLKIRKKNHKYASKGKSLAKFYAAIRKHGWENFAWEIIYQTPDKEHCLEMEKHFIIEFDSINNGYNIRCGGDLPPPLFAEKNGMFGRRHTEEAKTKMSKAASKRLKGRSYEELYGKEKADKVKQERSKIFSSLDRNGVNNSRYDDTIYEFIRGDHEHFRGTRLAFLDTTKSNKSQLCMVIAGQRNHVSGWTLV